MKKGGQIKEEEEYANNGFIYQKIKQIKIKWIKLKKLQL